MPRGEISVADIQGLSKTRQELYELGDSLFHGKNGVVSEKHRALALWKAAAGEVYDEARPDPNAMYSYAMAIKAGVTDDTEDDGGKAVALAFLTTAASKEFNHARSMSALGHSYEMGDLSANGEKNAREALRWYLHSAKHGGGPPALYAVACLYQSGPPGVTQDVAKAIQLHEAAVQTALEASASAQSLASAMGSTSASPPPPDPTLFHANMALNQLYCAEGPNQNWDKGFQACQRALEASRAPHAIWTLANHYYWGKGVEESLEEAARLYEEVTLSIGPCIYTTLSFYACHSISMFLQAAEAGFAYAQINLATMYRDGVFFPQNLDRALYYLDRAAPHSEIGADLAREIREQMR